MPTFLPAGIRVPTLLLFIHGDSDEAFGRYSRLSHAPSWRVLQVSDRGLFAQALIDIVLARARQWLVLNEEHLVVG